jgi:hypothetical protein
MISQYFMFEIIILFLDKEPWDTKFLHKTAFLPKMPREFIALEDKKR